jgi:hypothetical protein
VRDLPDSRSRVDIRWVDELPLGGRQIRVFIDGEPAGEMEAPYQRARSCCVGPGSHALSVSCRLWRSTTIDVDLAPGETAMLECGFERPRPFAYGFWAIAWFASFPLNMVGLPLTGFAAMLLVLLALGYVGWRQWITAGGYLFLRPRAAERPWEPVEEGP